MSGKKIDFNGQGVAVKTEDSSQTEDSSESSTENTDKESTDNTEEAAE